jgi:hypothetical protein
MIRVFIGMTLLIGVMLMPLIHALALLIIPTTGAIFPASKLIGAYGLAAIFTTFVARQTQLSKRLSKPIPGLITTTAGIACFILIPALVVLLTFLRVDSPVVFFLPQNGLANYLGTILLFIGCGQTLLAARDVSNTPLNIDAQTRK